jgi:tetratricopeptide (TPR) repeat protein
LSDLAWIEVFRQNENKAQELFQRAIRVDPNDPVNRVGLGLLYERRKLTQAAVSEYAHAIAESPLILDSRFFEDFLKRDPSQANLAVKLSCDLLSRQSSSPVRLARIARIHAYMGEDEVAHEELEEALSQLPNLPYAFTNLGILELKQGNVDLARIEFERAHFLDGMNQKAVNMLAVIQQQSGMTNSAKRFYTMSLLFSDTSTHSQRCWRLYHIPSPAPDDLVPQGLVSYLSPKLQTLDVCDEASLTHLQGQRIRTPDVNRRISEQYKVCDIGALGYSSHITH